MGKWLLQDRKLDELDERLQDFYQTRVEINPATMAHATEVMKSVMLFLQDHLHKNEPNYPVGDSILSGSVADGLKVCEPDEFDVLVPIRMSASSKHGDDKWYEKRFPAPELTTFQIAEKQNLNFSFFRWECERRRRSYWPLQTVTETVYYDDRVIQSIMYISPEKVAQKLERLLFQAINLPNVKKMLHPSILDLKEGKRHEYTYGPAAEVKVVYRGLNGEDLTMSIDFVGFLKMDGKEEHVVNPYYTIAEYISTGCAGKWSDRYADPTVFWKRSYSSTERRLIEKSEMEHNVEIKQMLMIYKAFLRLNRHLKNEIVSSYYIKNIALILGIEGLQEEVADLRKYDCTDHEETQNMSIVDKTGFSLWTSKRPSLQLIEMTKYMYQFVVDGKMPWAFESRVFLHFDTRDQKKSALIDIPKLKETMKNYLQEIIETDNWLKLLQDAGMDSLPA